MIVIWHEVSAMQSFIPRSGNDLQPNVAARRLRWVGSVKMTPQPRLGLCHLWALNPRVAARRGNPGLGCTTALRFERILNLIGSFSSFVGLSRGAQFLVIRGHLDQAANDARQDVERIVDLLFGVIATKRETDRPPCRRVRNVHGSQRRRGFVRVGAAGRTGGNANTSLVEMRREVFAFEVLE